MMAAHEPPRSAWRTLAGFALAVVVAPLATVLILFPLAWPAESLGAAAEDLFKLLVLTALFATPFAALAGLILGVPIVVAARLFDTRSPLFFAAGGLAAGAVMAWLDTLRTGHFVIREELPFVVGGLASALAYWSVVER